MKVILRDAVTGLGEAGAVVEVAAGYARNYLLPRKLAIEATRGNLRNLDQVQRMVHRRQNRLAHTATGIASRLGDISLVMRARAGEDGRLYGSITTTDIAEALQERYELEVDKRRMEIPEPIRVVGSHEVRIRLHPEVEATLTVTVEPEDEEQRARMHARAAEAAEAAAAAAAAAAQAPAAAPVAEAAAEEPPAEPAEAAPEPVVEQAAPEPVVEETTAEEPAGDEPPAAETADPETE
jgi:large subunit ribosomal protein L9